MAEVSITHSFVSAKAEHPDATVVSTNEWNTPLLISGGSTGQTVVRDQTQPHGARWVQGPQIVSNSGAYSGGAQTSPGLASISVAVAVGTTAAIVLSANVSVQASSGQVTTITLYRDGSPLRTFSVSGASLAGCRCDIFTEPSGTH